VKIGVLLGVVDAVPFHPAASTREGHVYGLAAFRPQEQGMVTQARHLCWFVLDAVKLEYPKEVIFTAADPRCELHSYG
jgi:hypothetical protein